LTANYHRLELTCDDKLRHRRQTPCAIAPCPCDSRGFGYFVSGPTTGKARNLAADGRCSFAISLPNLDLALEGTAVRVTDTAALTRVAEGFDERGWPLRVDGDEVTAEFWARISSPSPFLRSLRVFMGVRFASARPSCLELDLSGAPRRGRSSGSCS